MLKLYKLAARHRGYVERLGAQSRYILHYKRHVSDVTFATSKIGTSAS